MKSFKLLLVIAALIFPIAAGASERNDTQFQGILPALQVVTYEELSSQELSEIRGTAATVGVTVGAEGSGTGDSVLVKTKANTNIKEKGDKTVAVGRAKVKVVVTGDDRSAAVALVADAFAEGDTYAVTKTNTNIKVIEKKNKTIVIGKAFAKAVAK
jgi:hypothetical protein